MNYDNPISSRNSIGFTLIEVLIATVLLAIILASIIGVLFTSQRSFNESIVQTSLESEATILMDRLTEYISECKIVGIPIPANQHASITIQIPVLVTGTYWSADGNAINWGAGSVIIWTMTYQFTPKETLDETVTHLDYNKDKDILDKFERGRLELVFKDAGAVTQNTIILSNNVIVVYGSRDAGIMDGSVLGDPLFLKVNAGGTEDIINGNRLKINIWLSKTTTEGIPIILNIKGEKTLLNPQIP